MRYQNRRHFTTGFKREAVKRSLGSCETVATIAGELGIHPETLSRWRRELVMDQGDSKGAPVKNAGPSKSQTQLERENARLRKRLKRAELENEILKKATEYFTKSPK